MFEWFYMFWEWLSKIIVTDEFWQPYLNMGNWFYVVTIGMTILYAYIVFGGRKEDENLSER